MARRTCRVLSSISRGRGFNEPAIAGGMLVAPGLTPGVRTPPPDIKPAKRATEIGTEPPAVASGPYEQRYPLANARGSPLTGWEFFRCSVPRLTPGATDMPPALQAGSEFTFKVRKVCQAERSLRTCYAEAAKTFAEKS